MIEFEKIANQFSDFDISSKSFVQLLQIKQKWRSNFNGLGFESYQSPVETNFSPPLEFVFSNLKVQGSNPIRGIFFQRLKKCTFFLLCTLFDHFRIKCMTITKVVKKTPSMLLCMFTVFENHRKSLIQHCERSD